MVELVIDLSLLFLHVARLFIIIDLITWGGTRSRRLIFEYAFYWYKERVDVRARARAIARPSAHIWEHVLYVELTLPL